MPAKITKRSILTNVVRTMEFSQYTQAEFDRRLYAYTKMGATFEEAFPDLSVNAMQFIIDGTTPEDWEKQSEKRGTSLNQFDIEY